MNQNSPRICEMKTIKCCGLIVVWLCLGQLGAQTNYQVRMAYYSPGQDAIPVAFYERVRANKFDYVLAEYNLDGTHWKDGCYKGDTGFRLREKLQNEFIAADRYGLKLIPLFQTSNGGSWHWGKTGIKIDWQTLPPNADSVARVKTFQKFTTLAPDTLNEKGLDYAFKGLLDSVIYKAFNSVKLSYRNLDYIHFGADEQAYHCTIGVVPKHVVMAGLCDKDRKWLKSKGYDTSATTNPSTVQSRIVALLGQNIKRKVRMINEAGIRHGHNTTALYYGDMLDPNHNGGGDTTLCSFGHLSSSAPTAIRIKTSGVASSDSVQAVRNSSIVVQWNYDRLFLEKDYDTDSTFRYFAGRGLKFLHGNTLAEDGDPINNGRWYQLDEQMYVGSRPKYDCCVRGFVSFHWHNKPYDPNEKMYKTMEFLWYTMWNNVATFE
jgi:hypothetical protein